MIAIIVEKSPNSSHMYDRCYELHRWSKVIFIIAFYIVTSLFDWLWCVVMVFNVILLLFVNHLKNLFVIYRQPDDWYYSWNHGRTYDLSLDFFNNYMCIYIYIYMYIWLALFVYCFVWFRWIQPVSLSYAYMCIFSITFKTWVRQNNGSFRKKASIPVT